MIIDLFMELISSNFSGVLERLSHFYLNFLRTNKEPKEAFCAAGSWTGSVVGASWDWWRLGRLEVSPLLICPALLTSGNICDEQSSAGKSRQNKVFEYS